MSNENGIITATVGKVGYPLGGGLAECRRVLKQTYVDTKYRDILRAIAKRLVASGLDPNTATLAQMKTAIEQTDVDV